MLNTLGHDGHALLRQFGIDKRALRDPLVPSSIHLHGRILLAAIELAGHEDLPLLVGGGSQLENVGPVRALALNAATARAALEDLRHYASMWYRGLNMTLEEDQGYAVLGYTAKVEFPGREALLSAYLAGGMTSLRLVLGTEWKPALVRVAHRRPANLEAWAKLFRAPILFDQPRHELLFPAAELDKPRGRTDAQLDAFLKRQLDALEVSEPSDFAGQVKRAIESQLLRGDCSNERIASMFGVHRHTLYRRLAGMDADYTSLLEQSRCRLATQLLSDTDMPLGEIAAMLGYSTQGNFTRAFCRWFKATPSEWRRANTAQVGFMHSRIK
ncbi:AraC family transcriptional regulator ligand-binding domain-containing protein [Comamonas sp.]|uniref:AraC family transcriptional regulator n=1 Tax=Comamonas sp. TaxID=34028 RepID=UPI003A928A03